jgi:hypothetical protein
MKNRMVWGLVAVPMVLLASLALGGTLGGAFGHLIGPFYNPPKDPMDSVGQVDYELLGTVAGALIGLLLGLAWSFVILTEHRRNTEE